MGLLFRIGNEILNIDVKELSGPLQDDKIKIFFYKNYILKALPIKDNQDNFFSKISDLKRVCQDLSEGISNFVSYYGLPLSSTMDYKNYLKLDFENKYLLLLYRKSDLDDLNKYLEDEDPLSDKRKTVYKNLIQILIELEKFGVKLFDLYPDNFLVDQEGRVYLADLVGAGIVDENKQWKYKPLEVNKEYIFPLPPEVALNDQFFYNSNIWLGVYLIFFILTGRKPFDFLARKNPFGLGANYDHKYLESVFLKVDFSEDLWPPAISLFTITNINIDKYNSFSKTFNSIFKKGYFSRILMNTYVRGYRNYQLRPDFEEIDQAVISEIETEKNHKIKKQETKEARKHDDTETKKNPFLALYDFTFVADELHISSNELLPSNIQISSKEEESFTNKEEESFANKESILRKKDRSSEQKIDGTKTDPFATEQELFIKHQESGKAEEIISKEEISKEEISKSDENVQNIHKIEKNYSSEFEKPNDIDESKLLSLAFSTRQYVKKIISNLKQKKLYDLKIKEAIETLMDEGEINFLVSIFIKTRDMDFIGLVLKFVDSGYWQTFISNLRKLSEISETSIYKIILTKIIPLINEYKRMGINLTEYDKEIFQDLNNFILKEIILYKKNFWLRYFNIFLIFVVMLSLAIPWVLFYVFKWSYLMVIFFYPVVFIFLLVVFNVFFIISRVR